MSLGRASFVSKSGIANLLNTVKKEGLPATYDRSAQFRARKQVCQTITPYGKLVVTIPVVFPDGKKVTLLARTLWHSCITIARSLHTMLKLSESHSDDIPVGPPHLGN